MAKQRLCNIFILNAVIHIHNKYYTVSPRGHLVDVDFLFLLLTAVGMFPPR